MDKSQPTRLIDDAGKFNYGRFTKFVNHINPLEVKTFPWGCIPRFLKNLRLKEWHAYMIGNKQFYILIAAINWKHVSMLKVLIYDKDNNQTWGTSEIIPLQSIPVSEISNIGSFHIEYGKTTIYSDHHLAADSLGFGFSFIDELSGSHISGCFEMGDVINEPQVSVLPLKNLGGMYTHKQILSLSGEINVDSQHIKLKKEDTCLMFDDQKVYYPYRTDWDWATASCVIDGDYCGFTLSDVKSIKKNHNENGFWKSGKLHMLPNVRFCRNKASGTWSIVDEKGLVNVMFRPVMKHIIRRNFMVASVNYEGPLGWYSGHLTSEEGVTLHVNGMFGMGEKMNLRL